MTWSWSDVDWIATAVSGSAMAVSALFVGGFASLSLISAQELSLVSGTRREHGLDRIRTRFGLISATAFALLIGGAFVAVAAEQDPKGIYGSNSAAWVQAMGSIAAVVGAAAIAFWQAHQQDVTRRRADRKVRVDRVIAMGSIAMHLAKRLQDMADEVGPGPAYLGTLLRAYHDELEISANRISTLFDISLGGGVIEAWVTAEARLASLQATLSIASEESRGGHGTFELRSGVLDQLQGARRSMTAVGSACFGPMLQTAIGTEAP